jgi:hypothetical protein
MNDRQQGSFPFEGVPLVAHVLFHFLRCSLCIQGSLTCRRYITMGVDFACVF